MGWCHMSIIVRSGWVIPEPELWSRDGDKKWRPTDLSGVGFPPHLDLGLSPSFSQHNVMNAEAVCSDHTPGQLDSIT